MRCVKRWWIRLGADQGGHPPASGEGPRQQGEHPRLAGLGLQRDDVGAEPHHPAGESRAPVDDLQPHHCLDFGVPAGLGPGSLPRVSEDIGPRIGRAAHGDDGTRRRVASGGWASPAERAFGMRFAVDRQWARMGLFVTVRRPRSKATMHDGSLAEKFGHRAGGSNGGVVGPSRSAGGSSAGPS